MTTYYGGDVAKAQESVSAIQNVIIGIAVGASVLTLIGILICIVRKNNANRQFARNRPPLSISRSQMQYYQPAAPGPSPNTAPLPVLPTPFDAAYFPTPATQHAQAAPPATETIQPRVPDSPPAASSAAPGRELTNPFLRQMARLTVVNEDSSKPAEVRLELLPESPAAGPSLAGQTPGLRSQSSMQSMSVFSEPVPEYESFVAPVPRAGVAPVVRSGTLPPPYSPQSHVGGSAV